MNLKQSLRQSEASIRRSLELATPAKLKKILREEWPKHVHNLAYAELQRRRQ